MYCLIGIPPDKYLLHRWIVCGAAFLAHLLSTGLQLAYGALHVYALRHLGPSPDHAGKFLSSINFSIKHIF